MTMRMTVEHDTAEGDDEYGQPLPPEWEDKFGAPIPAFVWADSRMEGVNEQTTLTIVETRAMIPLDRDVTELDRVAMVQDRLGALLFPGPFNIRSVEYKKDHWELLLEGEAG